MMPTPIAIMTAGMMRVAVVVNDDMKCRHVDAVDGGDDRDRQGDVGEGIVDDDVGRQCDDDDDNCGNDDGRYDEGDGCRRRR